MVMLEAILAATVLALSAALLLRLALGEARRQRVDALLRRAGRRMRRGAMRVWHWRAHRRHAARAAEEAIRRARRRAERDGNVIRPESFKRPRKP
jgi:hypothetical protein